MGKRKKNRMQKPSSKSSQLLSSTAQIPHNKNFLGWINVPRYQAALATCTLLVFIATFYFNSIKQKPMQDIALPKILYIATESFLESIEQDSNIVIDGKTFTVYSDAEDEIIDILKKTNTPYSYVGIVKIELWKEDKLFVDSLRIPYESYADQLYIDSGYTTNKMFLVDNERLFKKGEFKIKIDEGDAVALLIPFCITRAMTSTDKLNHHETWNTCERIILRYHFSDGIYYSNKESDKEQHIEVTDMMSVKKILTKEYTMEPNEIRNDIFDYLWGFIEHIQ